MTHEEPVDDFRWELESVLEEFLQEQRDRTLEPPPWLAQPTPPCPRVDPRED